MRFTDLFIQLLQWLLSCLTYTGYGRNTETLIDFCKKNSGILTIFTVDNIIFHILIVILCNRSKLNNHIYLISVQTHAYINKWRFAFFRCKSFLFTICFLYILFLIFPGDIQVGSHRQQAMPGIHGNEITKFT